MLTLKEAQKIQKERESKALISFVLSIALVLMSCYVILEYTSLFSLSSLFYLIPIGLLLLAVKKTRIHLFLTPKEFIGDVVYLNVYEVQSQRVKGERSYMTQNYLEVDLIVERKDGKSKNIQLPASPLTNEIAVGTRLALLRFIHQPIIIDASK